MKGLRPVIIFEDNHLLVVVKPPGLLVQGDDSGRPTLLEWAKGYLKEKYHKPGRVFMGLVHRLDRLAGGVVILARTSKAASRLSEQFRNRETEKTYLAVIEGRLDPASGLLENHLVRRGRLSAPAGPDEPGSLPASLAYRTLETRAGLSLVEIDLHTGRRHQIRSQLAHAEHPLVGDELYGSSLRPRKDSIGLWARSLTAVHPTLRNRMTFESPPPSDWPWLPLEKVYS